MKTISIRGARLHNLKNIDVEIPKNQLVVLTGLSGSGKSTLAFDTLHKEGQRQYLESLGMVTDALSKPEVDAIVGLSPSISVDQHLTNRSPRSTVGTATEVFTYLRVLYAQIGYRPCTQCGREVPPPQDLADDLWDDEAAEVDSHYPCPHCGQPMIKLGMAHFSFNKPAGACPTCTGLGETHQPKLELLIDREQSVLGGGVIRWDRFEIERYGEVMRRAGEYYGFVFDPAAPIGQLGQVQRDLLLYGVGGTRFTRHFPGMEPPDTVGKGRFEGIVTNLLRRYQEHANNPSYRAKLEKLLSKQVCPDCEGSRLRLESRQVTVAGLMLIELCQRPLTELADWLEALPDVCTPEEWLVAESIHIDLVERVRRLVDVGVGYLTLDRSSPSLSAGEAQRLRLASLLGSGLTGVLYVLDEPTIGLHPRDNRQLIAVLRRLRDLGNTVVVIEHDLELIRAADYLIDIGPGAGRHGGCVVAAGSPAELVAQPASVTGDFLAGRLSVPLPEQRRPSNGRNLIIEGARAHNLQNLTVRIPLGLLVVVTGLSGSGKSSLILDVLDRAGRQKLYNAGDRPGEHDAIRGWEQVDKLVTIDQHVIGRTPRSNAATYTDAFGPIRRAFAATPAAQARGLKTSHFSFNVAGGRCQRCQGTGTLTVNMHFLPDVEVRCPACRGRRYRPEILQVEYPGFSIADVLDLTIEEAAELFEDELAVYSRLALMVDVGLSYLQLGQPATMLSGGEAQRVKLAKELGRRATGHTLYLLDEPTTGLHPADVVKLLEVLQRLVAAGNTVVTIEHNLDIIRAADWVIDLGPEGGAAGGRLVAEGTPEQVAEVKDSYTGAFLSG